MALVKPLDENEIETELCEFIQFFKGPLGVIPNSVRTMSRRPKVAKAFTELNMAVMECHGAVTPEFKRIIGYITSFVSGCRYCQAHTILGSQRFGANEDRLRMLGIMKTAIILLMLRKLLLNTLMLLHPYPMLLTMKSLLNSINIGKMMILWKLQP